MRNNKGITLIALVITIIVLLILAGVSIAMLSGENSILGRSRQTVWANELGEGRDKVALEWNAAYAEYLDKYYTGKLASGQTLRSTFEAAIAQFSDFGKNSFKAELTTSGVKVTSKSDQTQSVEATITYDPVVAGSANSGKISWNS